MATHRVLAAYLAVAVLFASLTAEFEWSSPIETPEGPWGWYRRFGVVNGAFVGGGHVAPGGGWMLDVHWPRAMLLPFYSGAGPESVGFGVAVWFVVACLALAHLSIRAATSREA